MKKSLFSLKNVQTLSSVKNVEIREAIDKMATSFTDEDGIKVSVTGLVAFKKGPNRSELSNNDSSFSATISYTDKDGKILNRIAINGVFSSQFFEKYGSDLIKTEYKPNTDYKSSDIKGSSQNAIAFANLYEIFVFDAFNKDDGEYPTHEDGTPIYENYVIGLPGEFSINPDQERKCEASQEELPA